MIGDEHFPTPQEKTIYDHLNAGRNSAIDKMREEARTIDPRQFDIDYQFAYSHYQADHEMPEEERERVVAEAVRIENEIALEKEEAQEEGE